MLHGASVLQPASPKAGGGDGGRALLLVPSGDGGGDGERQSLTLKSAMTRFWPNVSSRSQWMNLPRYVSSGWSAATLPIVDAIAVFSVKPPSMKRYLLSGLDGRGILCCAMPNGCNVSARQWSKNVPKTLLSFPPTVSKKERTRVGEVTKPPAEELEAVTSRTSGSSGRTTSDVRPLWGESTASATLKFIWVTPGCIIQPCSMAQPAGSFLSLVSHPVE
mmetsp:Transcript_21771/g.55560  ORF Transcript_21771/g.55560 Transcript_21771/m.55560 type:complete len:219 (-) Transcript_21771:2807-3463(-)